MSDIRQQSSIYGKTKILSAVFSPTTGNAWRKTFFNGVCRCLPPAIFLARDDHVG